MAEASRQAGQVSAHRTVDKKPLTLAERMAAAQRQQRWAQKKAERMAARAKELADAGDPRAAAAARLAERATAGLATTNERVGKLQGAIQKKAEHQGAAMAESAIRLQYLKKGLADRQPGGSAAGDAKSIGFYEKAIAAEEQKIKTQVAKADRFEATYKNAMPPGAIAEAAEKHAATFVKEQATRAGEDPAAYPPPPRMEDINVAMGQPPGGMAELNAKNEASQKQAPKVGPQAFEAPGPRSGPELGNVTPKGPTQSKSNLGGKPAPKLIQGEQGGWYYETKGGERVYVDK